MTRHHPLLFTLCTLLVTGLAGCGDEPPPEPVGGFVPYMGGGADSSGPVALAHCQITTEGEGFFGTSSLTCSPGDALSGNTTIVSVTGSEGYLGDLRLDEGELSLLFSSDKYPISITLSTYVEGLMGLDAAQVVTAPAQVASAEALAERQSILLPFELWTLTIEGRTNFGRVELDPFELTFQGGSMERGGASQTDATISGSVSLRAGETQTIRVPVNQGQSALTGRATFEGGEAPFELTGGGGYVLSPEGLIPSDDVTQGGPGAELARCEPGFIEGGLGFTCQVVVRPGVTLGAATVALDGGEAQALPLDGSPLALTASAGAEPVTVALSVQVTDGIDGLRWSSLPALEVEAVIERGAPEAVVAALPFDLLHASFQLADDVLVADFVSTEAHVIRFSEMWNNSYEATTSPLTVFIDQSDPDLWLAVTPGQAAVEGTFAIIDQLGARTELPMSLEATTYVVNANGLGPVEPPPAGAELARCWIDAEGRLRCTRDTDLTVSATVDIYLEPYEQALGEQAIDAEDRPIVSIVDDFLPIVLTLSVVVPGQEAPLTAERRVEVATELPETAPFTITTPAE